MQPAPVAFSKISGGTTTQINSVRAIATSRLSGRPSVVSTRIRTISWPKDPPASVVSTATSRAKTPSTTQLELLPWRP